MRLISLCCLLTLAACVPAVLLAQDGGLVLPICARCYVVCSLRDPCRVAHPASWLCSPQASDHRNLSRYGR